MLKKTKIVATISDRNCSVDLIKRLYKEGMNVVRLNTAHQTFEDTKKVIDNVRQVSNNIGILLDTKGPEIRITSVEKSFPINTGDIISIKGKPNTISSLECVYVNYEGFVQDVPLHSHILIDDGYLEFIVIEKNEDALICEAQNDGKIEGKKSVNVPGVSFKLPSLSAKDIDYVNFAIEQDIDFIAHSFVRNRADVEAIQKILDKKNSSIKIIAKIENQEGVDNIDEILEVVYGVMVARGDLAIEIPFERIPIVQKMLIKKCIAKRKPVIVATQMLHSMITNPRPTRAEVTDVADAIYSLTDAVMLSGETAYGQYPIESVITMSKIICEIERTRKDIQNIPSVVLTNERSAYITKMAVEAANNLNAKAIIADSSSGSSIRNMAGFRGSRPILAFCYQKSIIRQLSLSFGVFAEYIEYQPSSHKFIQMASQSLIDRKRLNPNDLVIMIAGNFGTDFVKSFIEISDIGKLTESIE